ncbi:MAG: hypothetical protein H6867_01660 [Rhodospirillales bacterium]|nr:hypothetical protein [Rhodospirillales bacterium]MCB9997224.1 hypothetical protein [Rhodospirillales bacterium]
MRRPAASPDLSSGRSSESGNVFFFILLAVALIGMVTVAIRDNGGGGNIDNETLVINASQVRQYVNDIERGITFIMQDGASESDIRFANTVNADYGTITDTPTRQVFHELGGAAEYRLPLSTVSGATQWEFYGHTHMPGVGTGNAELIAVLPDVTPDFCRKINDMNGYDPATQPLDNTGSECVNAGAGFRFTSARQFTAAGSVDTTNEATFTVQPAMEGCVQCGTSYHFFHVLMAR